MAETQVQRGVREAIARTDELSRGAHGVHREAISQILDALRSTLMQIDEALGGSRDAAPFLRDFARLVDRLSDMVDRLAPEVRQKSAAVVQWMRELHRDLMNHLPASREIPARPLLGVLPLARVIPQDVHSVLDYANGGMCASTAFFADTMTARIAGATLGASVCAVSAMTDYRLSIAKIIPIEAHEAIDYIWGATAIAAPFVLGYAKKDPAAAALHVLAGASTILVSLFTDYRAARGVGHHIGPATEAELAATSHPTNPGYSAR